MSHSGSKYFEYVNENKGMRLKLTGPMPIFYSQYLKFNLLCFYKYYKNLWFYSIYSKIQNSD